MLHCSQEDDLFADLSTQTNIGFFAIHARASSSFIPGIQVSNMIRSGRVAQVPDRKRYANHEEGALRA